MPISGLLDSGRRARHETDSRIGTAMMRRTAAVLATMLMSTSIIVASAAASEARTDRDPVEDRVPAEIGGESGTGDFIAEVFRVAIGGESGTGDFVGEVLTMAPGHECPEAGECRPAADPGPIRRR